MIKSEEHFFDARHGLAVGIELNGRVHSAIAGSRHREKAPFPHPTFDHLAGNLPHNLADFIKRARSPQNSRAIPSCPCTDRLQAKPPFPFPLSPARTQDA
jgi:hypothetical protein